MISSLRHLAHFGGKLGADISRLNELVTKHFPTSLQQKLEEVSSNSESLEAWIVSERGLIEAGNSPHSPEVQRILKRRVFDDIVKVQKRFEPIADELTQRANNISKAEGGEAERLIQETNAYIEGLGGRAEVKRARHDFFNAVYEESLRAELTATQRANTTTSTANAGYRTADEAAAAEFDKNIKDVFGLGKDLSDELTTLIDNLRTADPEAAKAFLEAANDPKTFPLWIENTNKQLEYYANNQYGQSLDEIKELDGHEDVKALVELLGNRRVIREITEASRDHQTTASYLNRAARLAADGNEEGARRLNNHYLNDPNASENVLSNRRTFYDSKVAEEQTVRSAAKDARIEELETQLRELQQSGSGTESELDSLNRLIKALQNNDGPAPKPRGPETPSAASGGDDVVEEGSDASKAGDGTTDNPDDAPKDPRANARLNLYENEGPIGPHRPTRDDPRDPAHNKEPESAGPKETDKQHGLRRRSTLRDIWVGAQNIGARMSRNVRRDVAGLVLKTPLNFISFNYGKRLIAPLWKPQEKAVIFEKTVALSEASTPRQFLNIAQRRIYDRLQPAFGKKEAIEPVTGANRKKLKKGVLREGSLPKTPRENHEQVGKDLSKISSDLTNSKTNLDTAGKNFKDVRSRYDTYHQDTKENIAKLKDELTEIRTTLDKVRPIDNFIQGSILKNAPIIAKYRDAEAKLSQIEIDDLKLYIDTQLERVNKLEESVDNHHSALTAKFENIENAITNTDSETTAKFLKEASDSVLQAQKSFDALVNPETRENEGLLKDIYRRFQRGYEIKPGKVIFHEDREKHARVLQRSAYNPHERKLPVFDPQTADDNPEKLAFRIIFFWKTHKADDPKLAQKFAKIAHGMIQTDHAQDLHRSVFRLLRQQGPTGNEVLDMDGTPVPVTDLIPAGTDVEMRKLYYRDMNKAGHEVTGDEFSTGDLHYEHELNKLTDAELEGDVQHSPDSEGPRAGQKFAEEATIGWFTALSFPQTRQSGISPATSVTYVWNPFRAWRAQNFWGLQLTDKAKENLAINESLPRGFAKTAWPGRPEKLDGQGNTINQKKYFGFGPEKLDAEGNPIPLKRITLGTYATTATNLSTLGFTSIARPYLKYSIATVAIGGAIEGLADASESFTPDWLNNGVSNVGDGIGDLGRGSLAIAVDWLNASPLGWAAKAIIPGDQGLQANNLASSIRRTTQDNNGLGRSGVFPWDNQNGAPTGATTGKTTAGTTAGATTGAATGATAGTTAGTTTGAATGATAGATAGTTAGATTGAATGTTAGTAGAATGATAGTTAGAATGATAGTTAGTTTGAATGATAGTTAGAATRAPVQPIQNAVSAAIIREFAGKSADLPREELIGILSGIIVTQMEQTNPDFTQNWDSSVVDDAANTRAKSLSRKLNAYLNAEENLESATDENRDSLTQTRHQKLNTLVRDIGNERSLNSAITDAQLKYTKNQIRAANPDLESREANELAKLALRDYTNSTELLNLLTNRNDLKSWSNDNLERARKNVPSFDKAMDQLGLNETGKRWLKSAAAATGQTVGGMWTAARAFNNQMLDKHKNQYLLGISALASILGFIWLRSPNKFKFITDTAKFALGTVAVVGGTIVLFKFLSGVTSDETNGLNAEFKNSSDNTADNSSQTAGNSITAGVSETELNTIIAQNFPNMDETLRNDLSAYFSSEEGAEQLAQIEATITDMARDPKQRVELETIFDEFNQSMEGLPQAASAAEKLSLKGAMEEALSDTSVLEENNIKIVECANYTQGSGQHISTKTFILRTGSGANIQANLGDLHTEQFFRDFEITDHNGGKIDLISEILNNPGLDIKLQVQDNSGAQLAELMMDQPN